MNFIEKLIETGFTQQQAEKLAKDPHFITNHKRKTPEEIKGKITKIAKAYGTNENQIRKAIHKFPRFATYNHGKKIKQTTQTYGNKNQVKQATLKFPPFIGYDHQRINKELTSIARWINITPKQIKKQILKNPVLASYSTQRWIAILDIAIQLKKEGHETNQTMLKQILKYFPYSPYVPKTNKQRITQAKRKNNTTPPPLLKKLRTTLSAKQTQEKY